MKEYLLLDTTKYLEESGRYTAKEICSQLKITNTAFREMIRQGTIILDKYIIIEDFEEQERDADEELTKQVGQYNATKYYVNTLGDVFTVGHGKKRLIKTNEKHKGVVSCYICREERTLKHLVAKAFLKEYQENDVIEHIDGDIFNCSLNNLRRVAWSDYMSVVNKKHSIPVNLYINNKLAAKYSSNKEAADSLFIVSNTVMRYVNGEVKNKLFDLRLAEAKS